MTKKLNEERESIEMENNEVKETGLMIKDFGQMEGSGSKSTTDVFTTITSPLQSFNL